VKRLIHRVENLLAACSLLVMAVLPAADMALRHAASVTIPASTSIVQNLTLWVTFLGAMLASREGGHLAMTAPESLWQGKMSKILRPIRAAVSAAVSSALFWASLNLVIAEKAGAVAIGGWLPLWVVEAVMPLAFSVMTFRFAFVQPEEPHEKLAGVAGVALTAAIGFFLFTYMKYLFPPVFVILVLSALAGVPIFAILGGLALLLFYHDGVPTASVAVETYRIVASPTLPAIPLFTLAGYVLAGGKASQRLVRLLRALFEWLPGGPAVAAIIVCTFFTTFTGASGVTILALGGLLLPVLVECGYTREFSIGLLTAAGSLGLLFPPSLPMILYGVFSHTSIIEMFKAGVVPGFLMVLSVIVFTMRENRRLKIKRGRFSARESVASLWESKWDLGLPVVIIVGIFGGYSTLVEAAALSAVYAIVVECAVHREMRVFKDLPSLLAKCSAMVGGVMVIVGVAMGLAGYLVDAEVPARATELARTLITSKVAFLMFLNIGLLVVGCLMDIFSALVVVVPLVVPVGVAFGISPVHLGIVFIANLELGYLTPPVGMNLFFSSYRFGEPVTRIYRNTLPFLLLLLAMVLVITYAPLLLPQYGFSSGR
jgi:C4-dicarboxylate transporter DctM subunit